MDKLFKLFDTPHHRRTMANSVDDMDLNKSSANKSKRRKTQSRKKTKTKGGKPKETYYKYSPNTGKKIRVTKRKK